MNIESKTQKAMQKIEGIIQECKLRQDLLVPAGNLYVLDKQLEVQNGKSIIFDTTEHSWNQVLDKAYISRTLYEKAKDHLLLPDLLNLATKMLRAKNDNYVLRVINDNLCKGFLSDRFILLDSSMLIEFFLEQCAKHNFIVWDAYNTSYRYSIFAIKNDKVILNDAIPGLELRSGDYGGAAIKVNLFIVRIVCENLMTVKRLFKQIHLGEETTKINFSKETLRRFYAYIFSYLIDCFYAYEKEIWLIEKTQDKWIDERSELLNAGFKVLERKLNKDDYEAIKGIFESNYDYNLPPGKNLYRLSNAVSYVARLNSNEDKNLI